MSNITWQRQSVTREQREAINGHKGAVIWLTGLSGAGKSTIANALDVRLHRFGVRTVVLDGDNIRHGLCSDLGFSISDRNENLRRVAEVARLFMENGVVAIAAFISPLEAERSRAREIIGEQGFIETYCTAGLDACERRDTKGLYKRARDGEIADFTGISSPYEEPKSPEITIDTDSVDVEDCVDSIVSHVVSAGILPDAPY